jgi:malonate transporter
VLKQTGLVRDEHWASVEHVAYYVLFPAIVTKSIAVADFDGVPVARMALAMILAILSCSHWRSSCAGRCRQL